MARGSVSQNPRPARAAPRPARASPLAGPGTPLDGVVAQTPHGAEDLGQRRLRRIDGDRQRRRAEVDVGAAHAALLAQRALELDRAVGAVHAGDVQDAALAAALAGQRPGEVERAVLVCGEGAVVLAVGLRAGSAGEGLDRVGVRASSSNRTLRRPRGTSGSTAWMPSSRSSSRPTSSTQPPHSAARGSSSASSRVRSVTAGRLRPAASRRVLPERSSGPCSTCSRVMSSSTRMCASSGE